jgi:hypothetical protein
LLAAVIVCVPANKSSRHAAVAVFCSDARAQLTKDKPRILKECRLHTRTRKKGPERLSLGRKRDREHNKIQPTEDQLRQEHETVKDKDYRVGPNGVVVRAPVALCSRWCPVSARTVHRVMHLAARDARSGTVVRVAAGE